MMGEMMRARQVCRRVGISYRQLDYWARSGLIEPSHPAAGSGTQRLYSEADVLKLEIVKVLLEAGVELPQIRMAVGVADWFRGLGMLLARLDDQCRKAEQLIGQLSVAREQAKVPA